MSRIVPSMVPPRVDTVSDLLRVGLQNQPRLAEGVPSPHAGEGGRTALTARCLISAGCSRLQPSLGKSSMPNHDHSHNDHVHEAGSPLPEIALRVKALESILVEKGYIDPAAVDAIVEAYET